VFQKNDDCGEPLSVDDHLASLRKTVLLYLMLGRMLPLNGTTLQGLFGNLGGLARNERVDEGAEWAMSTCFGQGER